MLSPSQVKVAGRLPISETKGLLRVKTGVAARDDVV